uniref:ATP synthase complex subunit 8 n=1 Tax=Leiodes picea TaxID=1553520 RepID=A0A343C4U6_9COLE|nr:ATP synthase F0 subunit 8 [Leiodes picea]
MPQMAPMNWLSLFIIFIIMFMLLNTLNYFSINYQVNKNKTMNKFNPIYNWKW